MVKRGLDVNYKFADHKLQLFVSLYFVLNLEFLKLRLRFLRLRGQWLGWFKGNVNSKFAGHKMQAIIFASKTSQAET